MTQDVWSAQGTTPDAIEAALREMLRERHAANQALAPARVLNLVVIVDRAWKGEIANRLERVGRYHASRTILCSVEEGRHTLDAVAVMDYEEPRPGQVGVMHEQVEIDLGPEHLTGLDTIIDPVVVSDLPTMIWCPHGHDEALQALLDMVDVILLDSDDLADPSAALARSAELLRFAYVVDLAWLRTTPWRERLAASFDLPEQLAMLRELDSLAIRHQPVSGASAVLLAGWLASRLRWEVEPLRSENGSPPHATARGPKGPVEIELDPLDQETPGLAGVTASCGSRYSLSLDRGRGGLRARERIGGEEREWQVLGASRGEGGILGEGVRQALLRDPTYGPALEAARELSP
ncbi:MAG TPA: glucose-6-phosphate dehydrogenase assembly protein OpcA [Solirubrobacteraceae bacterium]|nr:glucose-6-phosphate dehydrogenase assembly protein OpcA [Solirubrobacteraceae bacterium]